MTNKALLFAAALMATFNSNAQTRTSQKQTGKPKKIILLIGDGMGAAQIYAGLTANKGSLNLERCP
ncbi:MAG: hypothetical protein EOO02_11370 [Chitinophagaceae bacterium]|nr:MAG: hypothetical protein EOO02_11370 [Chitinophagaceae bacterium]